MNPGQFLLSRLMMIFINGYNWDVVLCCTRQEYTKKYIFQGISFDPHLKCCSHSVFWSIYSIDRCQLMQHQGKTYSFGYGFKVETQESQCLVMFDLHTGLDSNSRWFVFPCCVLSLCHFVSSKHDSNHGARLQ